MDDPMTPKQILREIAKIRRMERGTLHEFRKGPERRKYYNLQYQSGKRRRRTQYVPEDQVEDLKRDIEAYRKFKRLVEQYASLLVETTRAERAARRKQSE